MVVLLTLAVVVLAFIVVAVQQNNQMKERQQLSEASKTMSIDELLSQNDSLEREWSEWNEKWAKKVAWKRDASTEYNKRENAALKIKQIRATIKERFPEVLTDSDGLKKKAHAVATSAEKSEMRSLESQLDSSYKSLRASGITGGQLLESTHSSVLRGAAASTLAGPLAGGLTYAATEAQNKAITQSNIEKRAQNAVYNSMTDRIKGNQDQLNALYTEIIHKHDKDVKIHVYRMQYY